MGLARCWRDVIGARRIHFSGVAGGSQCELRYNCRNVCAIARMRGELFAACCPGNCNYVRKRIAMEK
jgi:hypothetical protein